ncbi:MAG: MATE family efflux transporter [Clostridia bacterium]|nr:MATE family efflux transporter [Clostridia bacterium]
MKEIRETENPITNGIIWKQLLIFFFPIMIGAFFQQLYNTMDAVIVGNYIGKEALSSVGGSSGQILMLVFTAFIGLATGATVIIAQHYGSQDREKLEKTLHTTYAFAVAGGLLMGALGVFFSRSFLDLLDTPENLMEMSVTYVNILMGGLVFTLIYNFGAGILRAVGDSRRPLHILIASCILNIALNYIFVVILGLGVAGAGAATVISQAVSAGIITWLLMYRTDGMRLKLRKLRIDPGVLARVLRIGVPTAFAECMYCVSNLIIQAALNRMGIDQVAAWTAYGRIDAMWWMMDEAFAIAAMTFVGQNYGAGKADRIRSATAEVLGMHMLVGILGSAIFIGFAPSLLGLFTDDANVIAIGAGIAKIITPFYPVFAIFEILSATLRAENHVMFSTGVNLFGICVFRIFWVRMIADAGDFRSVMNCYPISWVLIAALITVYFVIVQRKILRGLEQDHH